MKRCLSIVCLMILVWTSSSTRAQDSLQQVSDTLLFQGQLSAWTNYNANAATPLLPGARYIPTLNYALKFPRSIQLDFEIAANVFGAAAIRPFDSVAVEGSVSAYRAWARLSDRQWELRMGLQKINFGSASLLRPLMWFDQVDPRDPLRLTNGVWGLLGRYYFLNNANAWLWCLYGNEQQRPWDIGLTRKGIPELGGRYQHPLRRGEMGLSYHYRQADVQNIGFPTYPSIPEHRIGIDGRFDLDVGLWFEAAWIHKAADMGLLRNQELLNVGIDYTIGLGNGLHLVLEQLLAASDETAFQFNTSLPFSGLSLSYPLGIVDNLSGIVYFDWKNKRAYNFISWNHSFKKLSFYLMAYWNPTEYNLPQQGVANNVYAGPGIQIMGVYNH